MFLDILVQIVIIIILLKVVFLRELIATIKLNIEAKNPNNAYFNIPKRGRVMKSDYRQYKEEWRVEALTVMQGKEPFNGPVAIASTWCFGTLRKKDLQNTGKLELDAFNGIVYKDDSQIMEIHSSKLYQKGKPFVEIQIWSAYDLQKNWG